MSTPFIVTTRYDGPPLDAAKYESGGCSSLTSGVTIAWQILQRYKPEQSFSMLRPSHRGERGAVWGSTASSSKQTGLTRGYYPICRIR
jgi:hypothetical protein